MKEDVAMIGIIGAMDVEVDGIKKNIENSKTEVISGIKFCSGKLFGKDVVIAKSGEGKVNSAMTAQTMILKYNPEFIVNSGVAGGLHPDIKVLDIAIAENVCEHDYDISPLGYEPGFLPQVNEIKMSCDSKLNSSIEASAKKVCNSKIFKGTIASGDQFIATDVQKNRIKNVFGAIAAEMEGGSIGHVCTLNNTKFTVLRVISDNADGSADMSFEEFAKKASDLSINIMLEFVKSL